MELKERGQKQLKERGQKQLKERGQKQLKERGLEKKRLNHVHGGFTVLMKLYCRSGWKAKARALEMVQEEHDEQYSRLKDYRLELLDSNEGSTVEVETLETEGGLDIFFRFYVCFARIKKAWCRYSQPIFGVDGCFLNKLQTDLNMRDGSGFTIISDRQKGLLNAVSQLLPQVEHRMCARHIFWKIAKSYNSAQYTRRLEKLKMYDMGVYESVMQKNPKNCSLAFFNPTASCVDVSNNINESFNNAINVTREFSLVEMLETIRRRAMVRTDIRRKKAQRPKGKYSIKAMEKVNLEQKKILNCTAFRAGPGEYEVQEKKSTYKVHMGLHSCTCQKWEMSGIPCCHVLKVISVKKLNQEDYISSWYLNSRWRNEYNAYIDAVRGSNFWRRSGETEIMLPPKPETQGRKKVPKRIKERNESPQKKKSKGKELKVTREKRIMHCGRCGVVGHNTRSSKQSEPAVKKTKVDGTEEMCIGSSQPTQSQVID
ncbi:PREDICTED: uncharacterized protein LOC104751409 [Camelina sativa]|uniref:Uncharacterized protein LOC104751409 n=1 Tax=Camelina sativa TaxID=90675 RepID=A0ABM0WIR1_CAMSA|nr:PREDICTED: uncharacterized protein LOC104751409 [Camelina sativa]